MKTFCMKPQRPFAALLQNSSSNDFVSFLIRTSKAVHGLLWNIFPPRRGGMKFLGLSVCVAFLLRTGPGFLIQNTYRTGKSMGGYF